MKFYLAVCALLVTLITGYTGEVFAQNYPIKPICYIVGWPPGGGADTLSRPLAQKLSENLGKPVVIENRPGASGSIGSAFLAKSPADGYTIMMNYVSDSAINPSLYKKLDYDPLKDFAPITQVASNTFILVVHPSVPVKSVQELIALAKSKPGQINYGSAGNGSLGHLAGEMFKSMAGVDMLHIPYKGSAPVLTDLLAGRVSVLFADTTVALPLVKAGKLRALAVTGLKRSLIFPELPIIAESGIPGYEASSWWGIVAPAGTPKEIINKLNREIVKILNAPEMKKMIASLGAETVGNTPEEYTAYIKAEYARWAEVVKKSGASVD